jgi:7,8-dihydropterin-6-yl-methyl-4-(beta-D-ribofuranosyl)aminobenzene 5'-phosphate synthase
LNNLEALGLDPRTIDVVLVSHAHGDHTGGLDAVLAAGGAPTVYVPASFSRSFKQGVRGRTELVEVTDGVTVAPGIRSTGEVGASMVEQALVVDTADGPVVVTGCAHPGVVEMVRRVEVERDEGIALVVGGFHLGGAGRARIEGIIADLQSLGVKWVAPCHCTGDQARRMFSEAFDDACITAGVGWSSEYVLESE